MHFVHTQQLSTTEHTHIFYTCTNDLKIVTWYYHNRISIVTCTSQIGSCCGTVYSVLMTVSSDMAWLPLKPNTHIPSFSYPRIIIWHPGGILIILYINTEENLEENVRPACHSLYSYQCTCRSVYYAKYARVLVTTHRSTGPSGSIALQYTVARESCDRKYTNLRRCACAQ